MSDADDNLSSLFRSLGAGNSGQSASGKVAVKAAEQRWPLLKAMAPQKSASAPSLSSAERAHWAAPAQPEAAARKAALSVPGLNDKLAASLGKLSGRQAIVSAPTRPDRKEPAADASSLAQPAHGQLARPTRAALKVPTQSVEPAARSALFAASALPQAVEKPALFKRQRPSVAPVEPAASGSANADQSLGAVFGRLAGKPKSSWESPVRKTSSFLSRLGKR